MSPVLSATVILPSSFRIHGASPPLALSHASNEVPSNKTIASLGALPLAPGVTFGGTGSYNSVASGVVGSCSIFGAFILLILIFR